MKIYISLDMEGIAGTYSWNQEENNRAEVRKCISRQVEWVIEGVHSSSVNNDVEEIVIADSHSAGDSLLYETTELDDRLHLVSGYPRPKYMMPAFDSTYNIVFFIGYHGGICTLRSVMDHSYSPRFHRIWLQNKPMNESLINAAYAGYYNVPVGLVIGDDALYNQLMQKDAMPWVKYVVTKYSLSRFSVKSKPLNVVRNETIEAVKSVLSPDASKIPVYKFNPPVSLKIELQTASMADAVEMMPDVKRLDGVTIELIHNDYAQIFDAIDAIATLARSPKW
ncbi:MAG TPA: M55 family metallopeptidase [Ignavibacteria bacterium]|jgi:D-amino peptidase